MSAVRRFVAPMLCGLGLATAIPMGEEWLHEVKIDGARAIGFFEEGALVKLQGRRNPDITHRYPDLCDAIHPLRLKCKSAVVDGEICVLDKEGKVNFNGLQHREQNNAPFKVGLISKQFPATYIVFDLIEVDGRDLRGVPLSERRKELERVFMPCEKWRLTEQFADGVKLFEEQKAINGEGIICKRRASLYAEGSRSGGWSKVKYFKEKEVRVFAYEVNNAGITAIGDDDLRVQVAGRNGAKLKEKLDERGSCLIEVQYLEITEAGRLRMPTFRGFAKPSFAHKGGVKC
jgi:ATP-dependent DNA ligase